MELEVLIGVGTVAAGLLYFYKKKGHSIIGGQSIE